MSVVTGLAIEGVILTVQMGRAVYKRKHCQMDSEEFKNFTIEQLSTSGGSAAGGIGGSLAGVAAGAAVGSVVPVIGTAVGAFAGGLLGGVTGGVGGSLMGKQVGNFINSHRESNRWQLYCYSPNDIAVTPNNELIILDSIYPKAIVVSTELTVVRELSFSGVVKPSGIAVSGGYIIAVGDRSNHDVHLFSFDTEYLYTIKLKFTTESEGYQDVNFRMKFNSKGILYVLGFCNCGVLALILRRMHSVAVLVIIIVNTRN